MPHSSRPDAGDPGGDEFDALRTALAGRYRLDRRLGAGGMAIVYLAEDLKHRRQVAIKVLRPEITAIVGRQRFLREIEIAAKLTHPHVLPLHDSGAVGQFLYYVMPFAQGESLRARLTREKQLPLDEALRLTRQLADALGHAHAAGIVHRDLKPENVLLESGHAVLADFGIATAVTAAGGERLTGTGIVVGTPAYMSPEQAVGDAQLDARSDVYALGCVLYEMLAGEPPFSGANPQAVMARKSLATVPRLAVIRPGIPDRVQAAIDRALAPVPADRFASAAEFIAALGDDSRPVSSRSRSSRSRALAWLMVGVALMIAAVLGVRELLSSRVQPSSESWSLAVLYFDNLSPDTADAYLADGLTEDVSSRLARIDRLQVKSRHAVRRYRGTELRDLAAVAEALGVTYLVDGSVRRAGDRVRASVHLVDARTGFQVWSNDYDLAASDILSLQAEVAHRVAAGIAGRLLPPETVALASRPTDNAEAYDRFLRANYYLTQRTPSAVARAISEYERALRLDPDFTPARARAAYGYALYLDWGWPHPDLPPDTILERGSAAAGRALAQDSASADAWMARGYMLAHRDPRTLAGSRRAFERALSLDSSNAEAWHQYGSVLTSLDDDVGGLAAFRTAMELEPQRSGTMLLTGALHYRGRRLNDALAALDSAIRLDPLLDLAYALRALVKVRSGDLPGASSDAEAARRVAEDPIFADATMAVVEVARGDTAVGRARARALAATRLRNRSVTVEEGVFVASALAAAGDHQRAIDVLDRARPRGAHLFMDMKSPDLDPLRTHSRYQRIAAEARPF
jgi:serine/threonine-protein kinase